MQAELHVPRYYIKIQICIFVFKKIKNKFLGVDNVEIYHCKMWMRKSIYYGLGKKDKCADLDWWTVHSFKILFFLPNLSFLCSVKYMKSSLKIFSGRSRHYLHLGFLFQFFETQKCKKKKLIVLRHILFSKIGMWLYFMQCVQLHVCRC